MARIRVSLGFTYPSKANGIDYLITRFVVSKLCCDAPMNWGTLRVLALSKIVVLNPNGMWSLKNEIGYCRPQHGYSLGFDVSVIAPTSFEIWPLEDQPWSTLQAPWRLSSMGCSWMLEDLYNQKRVSLGFTYPSRANGFDNSMPRSMVLKWCTYELRHTTSFGIEWDHCAKSKWNVISLEWDKLL